MSEHNSQTLRRSQVFEFCCALARAPARRPHLYITVAGMLPMLALASGCAVASFDEETQPNDSEEEIVARSSGEPIIEPSDGINDDFAMQPQLPEFSASNIQISGCTGTGGLPRVRVTVKNTGFASDRVGVDLFVGAPYPPPIGTYSALGRKTRQLGPGESQNLYFTIPAEAIGYRSTQWFDVLVDTAQTVEELNEVNDHAAAELAVPDCSFN